MTATSYVWYLLLISPWDNASVVIPAPYASKAACMEAAQQAQPIGHEWPAKGYCIPAEAKERKE